MSVFSKACACTLFGAIAALSPITLSNASFIGAAWANGAEAGGKARINLSVKLKTLGQEIAAAACNIGADFDTDAAREELKIARSDFRKILAALEFGDELLGIPTAESQKKTLGAIERIKVVWQPLDLASDTLLFNGDTAAAAQMIAEQNLALLDATDVLAAQLAGQYSDPEQLAQIDAMAIGIAGRQRMFSQQLKKEACELNSSVSGITDPSSFQNTVEVFERSLVALRDGLPEAGWRRHRPASHPLDQIGDLPAEVVKTAVARRDGQRHPLAPAEHHRRHLAAGRRLLDESHELPGTTDLLPIELDDHVSGFKTGARRRAVVIDGVNEDTARSRQPGLLHRRRVHLADRHTEPSAATGDDPHVPIGRTLSDGDRLRVGPRRRRKCRSQTAGGDQRRGRRGSLHPCHRLLLGCGTGGQQARHGPDPATAPPRPRGARSC